MAVRADATAIDAYFARFVGLNPTLEVSVEPRAGSL